MKPLGAITKYYRFIDKESKSILNSLMDESSSYFDLVQRLSDVVLENEVPVNLAYIAAVQAWWTRDEKTMSLIQEKYGDVIYIRPWGYRHASVASDQARYHDAVVECIEQTMELSPADWLETELHLLHAFFHWPFYGDTPSLLEPLEKAKSLIDANPFLDCFEPLVLVFEGSLRYREGDLKGSLITYQRALELSEKNDDSLLKYMSLLAKANASKSISIEESLALFETTYDLTQELGGPYFVAEVLNDSAIAYEIAGEYDLAISSQQEQIRVYGTGEPVDIILSRIYSTLDLGKEALEWANQAVELTKTLDYPLPYFRRARALAVLGRLDEAQDDLDTAYPIVLKSGSDIWLNEYNWVSATVELARGNCLAASNLLEKALDISEHQSPVFQNIILLCLVKAELALDQESKNVALSFEPGKWLSTLETHAEERGYPGVRMQAALLKSEFYQNHGQLKDAIETLQQALEISDSPGVRTLTKMITNRIHEVGELLHEQETAPKTKRTGPQGGT